VHGPAAPPPCEFRYTPARGETGNERQSTRARTVSRFRGRAPGSADLMSAPLRIAINALSAVRGGGTTYFEGILPALSQIDTVNDYLLLRAPWQDYLPAAPGPNFRWHTCPVRKRSLLWRGIYEQGPMARLLKRERIDVLYSPADSTTLLAPCRVVLALRNAPAYAMRWKLGFDYWRRNVLVKEAARISAWRADRVVFVSDASRRMISRDLWLPLEKTVVIHHGIHPAFRQVERLGQGAPSPVVTRPYILSVSDVRRNKNYPTLVEAFGHLMRMGRDSLDLVILGAIEDPRSHSQILEIVARDKLEGRVHLPGSIPYLDLPAWYAGATLFAWPSAIETFGHPLVEAMASGLPIVAADAMSNPEILGGAGLLCDPWKPGEMAIAMARILEDPTVASDLSQKSFARAREFSWSKSAARLKAVLEESAAGGRPSR